MYILTHCDVKIPYQGLADQLGVTPKALTHRIANIKKTVSENRANAGNSGNSGGGSSATEPEDDEEEVPIPAPKKRKRAPAKKAAGTTPTKKGGKKAKVFKSEETVEENGEDEGAEPEDINKGSKGVKAEE